MPLPVIKSLSQFDQVFPDDIHLLEQKISSKTIYQGRYMNIYDDEIKAADGAVGKRLYVKHPGAAMIVPQLNPDSYILVRQFRYPVGQVFIEFPAGKIDPNESSLTTADRELQEEVGYKAQSLKLLKTVYPSIGYSNERMDIYLATGLVEIEKPKVEEEILDVFVASKGLIVELIKNNRITDPKTLLAFLLLESFKD
jgi:ADP-ribose pyrophosphatase